MQKSDLAALLTDLVSNSPDNFVSAELALAPELTGMKIFDEPLIGVAASFDKYFAKMQEPHIVGPHFVLPTEWLEEAQSVVSFFFPFTDVVKLSNRTDMSRPSNEWLHARIEGQTFLAKTFTRLKQWLAAEGHACVVPFLDERFSTKSPFTADKTMQSFYTSNWSERHVAHICGLGTFGLSKGLITEKGIAGRFASFITDTNIQPDARPYTTHDAYCTRCGACARNCPVNAISLEEGKKHPICSSFLDQTMGQHRPRYGCGKCQVKVPCESRIPPTRRI